MHHGVRDCPCILCKSVLLEVAVGLIASCEGPEASARMKAWAIALAPTATEELLRLGFEGTDEHSGEWLRVEEMPSLFLGLFRLTVVRYRATKALQLAWKIILCPNGRLATLIGDQLGGIAVNNPRADETRLCAGGIRYGTEFGYTRQDGQIGRLIYTEGCHLSIANEILTNICIL